MKKTTVLFVIIFLLCKSIYVFAQTEPEAIEANPDKFQEHFFEALKQKGIENYDRAIIELEQCAKFKSDDPAVYAELGKNYFEMKNYDQSYASYQKASEIDPKNKWFWAGMYEVSYATKNYDQAMFAINKLIEFKETYKEDLVSIYMLTNKYDKALDLINELNDKYGKSAMRDRYKEQILSDKKFQNAEADHLLNQIKLNPTVETNYTALIKLYTDANQTDKAVEITKKLESAFPSSDWSNVNLFKTYLDKNDAQNAINSMNIVLQSDVIDSRIKHRILNEFLIYVSKNPQYYPALERAVTSFDNDPNVNIAKEVGKFFQSKGLSDKAIEYYERSLKKSTTADIETNTELLKLYQENQKYTELATKSTSLVELYPTQPQYYYFAGLANNQLKLYKKAAEMLETGIDFVLDNIKLETEFNLQLAEAYSGLGDLVKKEKYRDKANQLLKNKK